MSIKERPELDEVVYPDSDGQPISDNTLQFEWISILKNGFERLFHDNPDVFVAGNLLWYPVEGDPSCRCAPDVLIAFGRPKGYRGSYRQWEEGGVAPQVVIEVTTPGNRIAEMIRKYEFYTRFGVQEYYIYDPYENKLDGWIRHGDRLTEIETTEGWKSPLLGTIFSTRERQLRVFGPNGKPILSYAELADAAEAADARAETERRRREQLEARMRALGIDPDAE